ncbi:MAG: hypothetical protein IPK26_21890 [Planctomycetes bacterium]|nr:hypothetical protein [Planctomycetota bacterium]
MARTSEYTLSVGTLAGKAFDVYLKNLVPFTFLSLVILSPWAVGLWWVGDPPTDPQQQGTYAGRALLVGIGNWLLTSILTGALTYGTVQQLRGSPASLAASVSHGLSAFFRVLGTGLLCGLRVFVMSLLLLIPGIMEAMKLYVALPVAVLEGKSGSAAVARSATLTAGSRWPLFWTLVLVVVLGMVFGGVAGFLAATLGGKNAVLWLQIGLQIPISAFTATMGAVAYFQLRSGKENVDARQIAAVFD